MWFSSCFGFQQHLPKGHDQRGREGQEDKTGYSIVEVLQQNCQTHQVRKFDPLWNPRDVMNHEFGWAYGFVTENDDSQII